MNLEKRIDNLDTVLVLLEKKLESVPAEIFSSIPAPTYNNSAAVQPEASSQGQPAAQQISQPPGASAEVQQQQQPQAAQPDAQPAPAPEDDAARGTTFISSEIKIEIEEYIRYIKMHKMGVPLPAIRIKMQAEGVDPDGLDVKFSFFEIFLIE